MRDVRKQIKTFGSFGYCFCYEFVCEWSAGVFMFGKILCEEDVGVELSKVRGVVHGDVDITVLFGLFLA